MTVKLILHLLDCLEWGQSDGKSQGQINGVVFGCGLSLSVWP